jgi:hypothetical protein
MRARTVRTVRALIVLGLSAAGSTARAEDAPAASPCPRSGDAVVVDTRTHDLWLCAGGESPARFTVALGRSGVGKRRSGDGRTPLGRYALGEPRSSERYGMFIPIGYPTAAQAARGSTGAAVGIHGPPRGMDAARYPVTGVDWTEGCIATGSDEEVGAIAGFVITRKPKIVIR